MAGSSVSSVEGTRAGSYEGEDVQAAAPQPAEVGIAAAEAIRIWDYLIGSNLGRRALRVVLASNAENAAVLFRLRLVARRFHSELPKYVASLKFGLGLVPEDGSMVMWRHSARHPPAGGRAGTTPAGAVLLVTCLSSCSPAIP